MSMAAYARRYCEMNLKLTWSYPGYKGPRYRGWQLPENALREPSAAEEFWSQYPDRGIGALLSYSNLVSLDVDDEPNTRLVLDHFAIDLDALRESVPCINGDLGKFRLMFEAPRQALKHRTVSWPRRDRPRESSAIFELRAGPVSDALPPTIHQKTGQPYVWSYPPRNGFPKLPTELLTLWEDWPRLKHASQVLCPWASPQQDAKVMVKKAILFPGYSVIRRFNSVYDVQTILLLHGYVQQGNRFAAPGTNHAAGIVVFPNGKLFCHHAGDPLGGGRARDAFDVHATLAHAGNTSLAVKSAVVMLGLQMKQQK